MQNSDGSRAVLIISMCSDDVVCSCDFVESKITPPCNTNSYYFQDIEDVTEICDEDYEISSELYEEIVISSVNLPPKFAKSCLVSSFKIPLVDNEIYIWCSSEYDDNNDDSADDDDVDNETIIRQKYMQQTEQLKKNSCQKISPKPEESKFNCIFGWITAIAKKITSTKEDSKTFVAPSEKSQPSPTDEHKATSRSEALVFVIFDYIYHPLSNLTVSCRNYLSGVT